MARHDPVEQALERLSALKSAAANSELLEELRVFLRNRSNLVVAKAAKIAGQRRLAELVPDLVAAP